MLSSIQWLPKIWNWTFTISFFAKNCSKTLRGGPRRKKKKNIPMAIFIPIWTCFLVWAWYERSNFHTKLKNMKDSKGQFFYGPIKIVCKDIHFLALKRFNNYLNEKKWPHHQFFSIIVKILYYQYIFYLWREPLEALPGPTINFNNFSITTPILDLCRRIELCFRDGPYRFLEPILWH